MKRKKRKVVEGARYGAWTIIKEVEPRIYPSCTERAVLCECDCGKRKKISLNTLIGGRSSRCKECYNKERDLYTRENHIIITENGENFKRCGKCGAIKPVSEFYKQGTAKDGLEGRCKDCCNALKHWEQKIEKYVYIVTHPMFPDWVKVGVTVNLINRLRNYQTCDPTRSYKIYFNKWVKDVYGIERYFRKNTPSNGHEWFKITPEEAKLIIIELSKDDFKTHTSPCTIQGCVPHIPH